MDMQDILRLVQAGYSKEDIDKMQAPVSTPEPAPEPQPEAAQPEPQPEAPVTVAQPEPDQPSMRDLMQSIAKLTSAIQANAIANSVIPGGANTGISAEDAIANIIRPSYKEKEVMKSAKY